jgi:hypothetical protein
MNRAIVFFMVIISQPVPRSGASCLVPTELLVLKRCPVVSAYLDPMFMSVGTGSDAAS